MDNAQKAIMIGVGLFITIIVIAAVMMITGMGNNLIKDSEKEVINISKALQAQLTSEYDGNTNLNGSQVIAAVNKYYNNDELKEVSVDGVNYSVNATSPVGVGNLSNKVRTADKYKSILVKAGNSVTGIAFTKN